VNSRPAEHYIHAGGGVVIVPARVCEFLLRVGEFDDYTQQFRGADAEFDNVLTAIRVSAANWRAHREGTNRTRQEEPAPHSQWLTAPQVATQLGMTDRGARKACAEGRIEAELVKGRWRVSREALQRYRRRSA
jgi:hypothetical protein